MLFLALRMKRPLFLEGEAGVGKTEIAKVLASALGRQLIRLQCYEGLDVSSAVYEWNYAAPDDRDPPGGGRGRASTASGMERDIFSEKLPDPPAGAAGAGAARRAARRSS